MPVHLVGPGGRFSRGQSVLAVFGVHQPHPDDPRYPKWSATRWPHFYIAESNGWRVVKWEYFPAEWFDGNEAALIRQNEFNQIRQDVESLYGQCERHNRARRRRLLRTS